MFLLKQFLGHLDYEEAYMKKHKFPAIAGHKRLHDDYRASVEKFKQEFEHPTSKGVHLNKSREDLMIRTDEFLTNWLSEHILTEDHKYAAYIKKHSK